MGYGSTVVAALVGCYYNVIIAWCLFYLGSSIQVSKLQIAPDIAANFLPSFKKKDELSNVSIQGFYRPFKINITPYSLSVVQTIYKKVV